MPTCPHCGRDQDEPVRTQPDAEGWRPCEWYDEVVGEQRGFARERVTDDGPRYDYALKERRGWVETTERTSGEFRWLAPHECPDWSPCGLTGPVFNPTMLAALSNPTYTRTSLAALLWLADGEEHEHHDRPKGVCGQSLWGPLLRQRLVTHRTVGHDREYRCYWRITAAGRKALW